MSFVKDKGIVSKVIRMFKNEFFLFKICVCCTARSSFLKAFGIPTGVLLVNDKYIQFTRPFKMLFSCQI
jgi:hypothetical protein